MSLNKIKRVINKQEVKKIYEKKADTLNAEDFLAFKRKGEERLREILFLGTTGNTFYTSQETNVTTKLNDLKQLINELDPNTTSQLISDARKDGFFRHIPIIALILLKQKSPAHFKQIFNDVILTGQDLGDYLDLSRSLEVKYGTVVKKAIHNWLQEKVNSFYALKYRKQITDAIAISRPKVDVFPNVEELKYAYAIKKKKQELTITNSQLKGTLAFKQLIEESQIEKALEIAKETRLPADLMISMIGKSADPRIWSVIAENMGVMQLLKYLNKLSSILDQSMLLSLLERRVTLQNLTSAKVFPYSIFIAWHYAQNSVVKTHLAKILEKYVFHYDFSLWKQKTFAIAPDVSGSMTTKPDNGVKPAVVAGYFSSVMAKALDVNEIYSWDTKLQIIKTRSKGILDIFDRIHHANGGGTDMSIPIRHLVDSKIKKDVVIVITDNEHWYGDHTFMEEWKEYKQNVNKNAKCVVIEVVGYGDSQVEAEFAQKYDVYTVYGWSDVVFRYIEMKVL